MNYLEHFRVEAPLPFLFMQHADTKEPVMENRPPAGTLSLAAGAGNQIESVDWDDVWGKPLREFSIGHVKDDDMFADRFMVCINTLRNEVAARTRRQAGNLIFIGPWSTLAIRLQQRLDKHAVYESTKLIIDPDMPFDEIRVCLNAGPGMFVAKDAPFQVYGEENTIVAHPNPKAYFAWAKLVP